MIKNKSVAHVRNVTGFAGGLGVRQREWARKTSF